MLATEILGSVIWPRLVVSILKYVQRRIKKAIEEGNLAAHWGDAAFDATSTREDTARATHHPTTSTACKNFCGLHRG